MGTVPVEISLLTFFLCSLTSVSWSSQTQCLRRSCIYNSCTKCRVYCQRVLTASSELSLMRWVDTKVYVRVYLQDTIESQSWQVSYTSTTLTLHCTFATWATENYQNTQLDPHCIGTVLSEACSSHIMTICKMNCCQSYNVVACAFFLPSSPHSRMWGTYNWMNRCYNVSSYCHKI